VEALDVLAGGEQQLAGVAGRDSEQLGRPGCGGHDERCELGVELTAALLMRSREASD
jgi:hypothetical protein